MNLHFLMLAFSCLFFHTLAYAADIATKPNDESSVYDEFLAAIDKLKAYSNLVLRSNKTTIRLFDTTSEHEVLALNAGIISDKFLLAAVTNLHPGTIQIDDDYVPSDETLATIGGNGFSKISLPAKHFGHPTYLKYGIDRYSRLNLTDGNTITILR